MPAQSLSSEVLSAGFTSAPGDVICILRSCCSVSCAQNGALTALSDGFLVHEAVKKPVVYQLSPSSLCLEVGAVPGCCFPQKCGNKPMFSPQLLQTLPGAAGALRLLRAGVASSSGVG